MAASRSEIVEQNSIERERGRGKGCLPECDSKWNGEQISWRFQLIWGCKYFERICQLQEWLSAVALASPLMAAPVFLMEYVPRILVVVDDTTFPQIFLFLFFFSRKREREGCVRRNDICE